METSTSLVGIIRCDRRGRIKSANASAHRLLHATDLVGRSLDQAGCDQVLLDLAGNGLPFSRCVDRCALDGTSLPLLVNVAESGDDVIITFEPVEWSLAAWSHIDGTVLVLDGAGRVVFAYHGNPRLPGLPRDSALGRSIAEVSMGFAPSAGVSPRRIEAVMSGVPDSEHFDHPLPDGGVQSINVRMLPWRYCGCTCGVIVLVTDVTHVSQSAAQNARAIMYRLMHAMQHELRNPLQTMQAAAELLRPLTLEPGHRTLGLLIEQIQTVNEYLADQILVGLPGPRPTSLGRLSDVVAREMDRASLRFVTDSLVFDHRPPADEVMVRLRPESMGRVFANLFRNVAQVRPHAHVAVTYVAGPGHVTCTVADDGPGFPEAVLGGDWLVRSEPTQHIGLALAASTVHVHGGTMAIGNRGAGGAFVEIRLPAAEAPDASQSTAQREAAAAAGN